MNWRMFKRAITVSVLVGLASSLLPLAQAEDSATGPSIRRKRYVVFPEGSSFSVVLCMTMNTLTPDSIFTEGVNWGISYDLPNETKPELAPFLKFRKDAIKQRYDQEPTPYENNMEWNNKGKYYLLPGAKKYYKANYHYTQRRHRRDLYGKLEVVMDAMGYDGRTCILRALCEASQRFVRRGNNLLEEMMRIVFTLPLKKVFSFEPPEHHTYTEAHRAGHQGTDCLGMFSRCSFSLIDMALGKYNVPDDLAASAAAALPLYPRYTMK